MIKILTRLFLFALLVGDWAWDTHFGTDTFSRPMSSSNVTQCTSIARPSTDGKGASVAQLPHLTLLCLKVELVAPHLTNARLSENPFLSSYRDPLYVFMSLRC